MAFTYVPGTYDFWAVVPTTHIVPMHEVAFVRFSRHPAVGTAGLGSCSVVAIVSDRAVILAHIPPRPDAGTEDRDAGGANVLRMMGQVRRHFHDRYNYFANAGGRIVCAIYAGEVALPDQVAIMDEQLRQLGLVPSVEYYEVPPDGRIGRGTVTIVGPQDHQGYVGVYVEDVLVSSA